MRNRFIAGLLGIFFISFTYAGKINNADLKILASFSDTADKKADSLNQASADPKQEFKDLFVVNATATGFITQQLNPQAVSFVQSYIEKNGQDIEEIRDWGRPYLSLIETILLQHGLPKELKYLAVIESNLKNNARSWAGAVGPWQFMPTTARDMGLKVGGKYDERRDFSKSTHAASRYLSDLFAIYGDWLLVIAAYNGGTAKVNAAIKKSGSRDFWTLQRYLPTESKNHVKKFIATHYILEGGGGITTATREEAKNFGSKTAATTEEMANSKTQSVNGRYSSLVIAKYVTMDIAAFNRLNPDFDKLVASGNDYTLRLPNEKMEIFMAKKPEILNESMQLLLSAVNN